MIQKLMNKPLLLSPQGLESINAVEWLPTEIANTLNYEVRNGVAIIPIYGLLTKRTELFSSLMGMTSYDDIFSAISDAIDDEKVERILLDIDSPGGEVGGLFDLVDSIYDIRECKPIFSVANDYACSAAYAIASATSHIFVNRTSCVGSVGVIATHLDVSEADKKAGLKYTTIFAGEKKNDLSPHEPLSKSAITDLQEEVNRLNDIFIKTVAKNRYLSEEDVRNMQAATYFGENAVKSGLADELISNSFYDLRKYGIEFENVSKLKMKGENMTEDIEKTEPNEVEKYRTEVLEIAKLCKLAKAENKIAKFIMDGATPDQVKEQLLAMQSQNESKEIISAIYQKEATQENPVLAAAKSRIK